MAIEEKGEELLEIIAVRPWFTVDTHLGTPVVSLHEGTAFDGELYAVDAGGERQTFLKAPPKPRTSTSPQAESDGDGGVLDGAGRSRGGDGLVVSKKTRSVEEEVKVRRDFESLM